MGHAFTLMCDVCKSKNVLVSADTFFEVSVRCLDCDVEEDEEQINPDVELIFPEDRDIG